MGDATKIEWTDHTFNPWIGCTRVSPGCEHCYAESMAKRTGRGWGVKAERQIMGDPYWKGPIKWNRAAEREGRRHRVFCASMADVFEPRPELERPRERLWGLVQDTPWLDWQILTKRPENADALWCDWERTPNVWLGTSVEDQQRADERIPHLLRIPAAVRFLSCEPLLEAVDLRLWLGDTYDPPWRRINWVIVGGESGPGARRFALSWARSLVAQCKAAEVDCFVKQLGAKPAGANRSAFGDDYETTFKLLDPKGGNWDEWPADLRVREFPAVSP